MKKRSINSIITFALIISCMLLTGCSSSSDKASYKLDALADAPDGYYVLKEDQTFYPLMSEGKTKDNSDVIRSTLTGERITVMACGKNIDNIPTIEKGEKLVLKTAETVPSVVTYIAFKDYGYTLGFLVSNTTGENTYGVVNSNAFSTAANSTAETQLKDKFSNIKKARITSIGEQPISENIITDIGTVSGLEKDHIYEIVFYEGTKQIKTSVAADTQVFCSVTDRVQKFSQILFTERGYALMEIGDDIQNGYYMTEDGGLFYYNGKTA